MSEIIIAIFIIGISVFVSRLIIKSQVKKAIESCDHMECDKFCEVERERDMLKKDAQWVRRDRDEKMESILNKLDEL